MFLCFKCKGKKKQKPPSPSPSLPQTCIPPPPPPPLPPNPSSSPSNIHSSFVNPPLLTPLPSLPFPPSNHPPSSFYSLPPSSNPPPPSFILSLPSTSTITSRVKGKLNNLDCFKSNSFFKIYDVLSQIGVGTFGKVFKALKIDDPSDRIVAIKVEKKAKTKISLLNHEAGALCRLSSIPGFPQFIDFIENPFHSYLVMECLGPNLETLKSTAGGTFSLKTVVTIGCQMLDRLETLHNLGLVHRDIKPENFLVGLHSHNTIYLIDFGLCLYYSNPKSSNTDDENKRDVEQSQQELWKNQEKMEKKVVCSSTATQMNKGPVQFLAGNKKLIGTMRYASINSHLGILAGRRDDLESLAYVLIYFYKGVLPWQNIHNKNLEEQEEAILKKKEEGEEELCRGLPNQFKIFLKYIKRLKTPEKPDYNHMRRILLEIFRGKEEEEQLVFEWSKKKEG